MAATCCLDAGVRALGYTCEKMGLIGPSARAADISNDKFKMKEAFMAGGVQCARHICIHSLEELEEALEKLEFPVVLKAVDLMGSRGIFRCNTREETFFYYNKTMEATRKDYCLVEEFIEGQVLGCEAMTVDGKLLYCLAEQYRSFSELCADSDRSFRSVQETGRTWGRGPASGRTCHQSSGT